MTERDFQLDARLNNDCLTLGELLSGNRLLLHKNASVTWLIVVPQTDKTELYELPKDQQQILLDEINRLSAYLKERPDCDKINVATIGNVVSQLHIHIISRNISDPYWPGVVWGEQATKKWDQIEIQKIIRELQAKQIISG